MTRGETLISVWQQALGEGRKDIKLEGETYPVTLSKAKGLRMVEFNVGPVRIVGIEQNPKGRYWLTVQRILWNSSRVTFSGRSGRGTCPWASREPWTAINPKRRGWPLTCT